MSSDDYRDFDWHNMSPEELAKQTKEKIDRIEPYRKENFLHLLDIFEEESLLKSKVDILKTITQELNITPFHDPIPLGINAIENKKECLDMDESLYSDFIDTVMIHSLVIALENLWIIMTNVLKDLGIKDKPMGTGLDILMDKIWTTIGVSGKTKQSREEFQNTFKELFYNNFRNAIIHRRFEFRNDGTGRVLVIWNKQKNETVINITALEQMQKNIYGQDIIFYRWLVSKCGKSSASQDKTH